MRKNRIELTGTIHKIFKLKTKAGGPLVKVLLPMGHDFIHVHAGGYFTVIQTKQSA